MDLLAALGIALRLLLIFAAWSLSRFLPGVHARYRPMFVRVLALMDIAGGTLMVIILGALLVRRAWLVAVLFGLLFALPSVRGLLGGFRTLVRLAPKDTR